MNFCRFLLYPFLAALVGIEKLRECYSTWFLLEQALQRLYGWKVWKVALASAVSIIFCVLFRRVPGGRERERGVGGGLHPNHIRAV